MRWRSVLLSEIVEFDPPAPRNGQLSLDSKVGFLPMSGVTSESVTVNPPEMRVAGEVVSGFTYFQNGDVLLAKITPCFENGKTAEVNTSVDHCFGSTEFHVIRANKSLLLPRYLTHYLRQPWIREAGERRMTGSAGQRRVPRSFLEELDLPLPTLEEQRRIVAILDKADALLRGRQQTLRAVDKLKGSFFVELFGKCELPRVELGDVTEFIDYRGISPNKQPSGVRLITARNVKRGTFADCPQEFIPEEEYDGWMRRGIPKPGDVLFTTEGHTLGSAAKLPRFDKVALAQRLIALHPKQDIRSDYLLQIIIGSEFQREVVRRSTGSAARGISSKQLALITIPIAPVQLQEQFGILAESIERLKKKQLDSSHVLQSEFAALESLAFRGEL